MMTPEISPTDEADSRQNNINHDNRCLDLAPDPVADRNSSLRLGLFG
jgi:hypothetical protein